MKILAIKRWFPFNFTKILQSRNFVVGGRKIFRLLGDLSFKSYLQNNALRSLQLFFCACYYADLVDIQRNELATSTARNFNNS